MLQTPAALRTPAFAAAVRAPVDHNICSYSANGLTDRAWSMVRRRHNESEPATVSRPGCGCVANGRTVCSAIRCSSLHSNLRIEAGAAARQFETE